MEPAKNPNIPMGAPNWMDLVTSDVDASVAFYVELFGWTVKDTPPEFEGYKYFEKDGLAVGGCMRNQAEWGMPDLWSIFLKTDDADAVATAAKENGGEVLMPPMKVAENGIFTIIRDCGGATISAWQPITEQGFGLMYAAGTPAHFELHTREYSKSVEFYKNVFKWNPHTLADETQFRYTGFGAADAPLAGIMDATIFLAADVPAHWSAYIAVDDADATVAKAVELGGKVVQAAEQTPYGKLATLADPTGAIFKLQA